MAPTPLTLARASQPTPPRSRAPAASDPVSSAPLVFPLLVIAGLLGWLYARTFATLVQVWWEDPNYTHGFLVPLVSGFFAYRHFRGPKELGPGAVGLGAMSILAGSLVHLAAEVVSWPLLDFFALALTLRGLAVAAGGREWAAGLTFPILFLFFMVPLPGTWTQTAALWLQEWVSRLSAATLDVFTTCVRSGVHLHVAGVSEPIRVAEECSGLRQIVAFVALAAALSYWFKKPMLYRCLIIVLAVPVAILANVLRVVIMAGGLKWFGQGSGAAWLHDAAPYLTMPIGLLLLGLIAWCLARIWPVQIAQPEGVGR